MKRSPIFNREAVERLRQLIHSTPGFQQHLRSDEPNWSQWVEPTNLPPKKTEELVAALKRLWLLPFADFQAAADLLLFQFTELPGVAKALAEIQDREGTRLCALFELLMGMALQGFSSFPQNPTQLAEQVRTALRSSSRKRRNLLPVLELLIHEDTGQPETGFNEAWLKDPDFIVVAEHNRRSGLNEGAWKTPFKYAEFEQQVHEHPRFWSDWKSLKRHFTVSRFQDSNGIVRRTRIEEGNWRRPVDSDLSDEDRRFQVAFDFFCWKWFLYGMKRDEPLVQKLAYTLTPYGTMIFIPGYWSFDPKRDLNWEIIQRLHRARGIERQGEKLSAGRKVHLAQLKFLLSAERKARQLKLTGESRYAFLKAEAGLVERTDNAQVRRLLREAKQQLGG